MNAFSIATEPSIDTTLLLKARRTGSKIVAQCPACAAAGGDRRGEHLFINTDTGKFGCGAFPGDAEHRREIFAHVGKRGERQRDPQRARQWREDRSREREQAEARAKLIEAARTRRAAIVARHPWSAADVRADSPQNVTDPLVELCPRHFLASLFPQDATIWTGAVEHSGTRYAHHWRTVREWQDARVIGPMISPATWNPGTCSRTAANVLASPFVVLDFDELDGRKPETPADIKAHVAASLAIVRWLREMMGWHLAAAIFTGSKSIHAWFHMPPAAVLQSLRDTAGALGIDAGLIGRPEHPARLPGQRHGTTGKLSRCLWLQSPIE